MNNQNLKLSLVEKFGKANDKKTIDFCREAYEFIISDAKGEGGVSDEVLQVPLEPQAIDLGLPSGTLWCDRNVGANSPYDYGAFFSWGNTEPHYPNRDNMDWGDDDNAFDYHFTSDNYEKTEGYKLKDNIDLAHDAARVNMGEPWRMPTDEQFQELYDCCTWVRRTINGINGYLVTSKSNGNLLFFACSGDGDGTTWYGRGSSGSVWSSSFGSARTARNLFFSSGGVGPQDSYYRCSGFAVRPVQNIVSK